MNRHSAPLCCRWLSVRWYNKHHSIACDECSFLNCFFLSFFPLSFKRGGCKFFGTIPTIAANLACLVWTKNPQIFFILPKITLSADRIFLIMLNGTEKKGREITKKNHVLQKKKLSTKSKTHLLESDGSCLLTEAATAKHETILADQALTASADAATMELDSE